jgi:hypothetical protein
MKLPRVVLVIVAASSVWAQNTVVLSGKITDLITGLPVENAAVALTQNGRSVDYTDAGGNYSFGEIAPGTGSVEIQATGYLPFQKTNPDEVSIHIAADHAVHNFRLTPVASISGRLEGETGGTLDRNISAVLFKEDFTEGVRHFSGRGPGLVSAIGPDGSFKFTGLEPGRYILSADPRAGTSYVMQMLRDRAPGQVPASRPKEGYIQTYYPGTTEFAAALLISVAAGEARSVDFKIAWRPLFRASGVIDLPGTESWKGTVQVTAAGDGVNRLSYSGVATVPGPFTVEGLPSGQYIANAVTGAPETTGVALSFRRLQVRLVFSITDHDIDGLRAVPDTQSQLGINGFFRMTGNSKALPGGLSVQYASPEPGGLSTPIPAAPSGEFWLTGVPGEYSVQPVVPAGYAATEIRYGGVNYLNSLIPMNGSSPDSSLTIVLTDQTGSVAGSIVDGDSKPVSAEIALVPDPLPAGFDFRAIRVVKNDSKGAFAISGLAPGRYKAVALTGDDRKRDHDMAILGDKFRAADSFEVVAGQSLTINVRQ